MATQRAVVSGTISSLVQVRHMFTCDVITSGGDTPQVLWAAYLDSVYNPIRSALSANFLTYQYQLEAYSAGHWVPFDVQAYSKQGAGGSNQLPNVVSIVLLGKAAGLRHVGRKFFGAVEDSYTNINTLTSAGLAIAASTLLAYITPFTGIGGGTITPGVVDGAGTFHPFVGGVVSTLLGSMRRRKPGIGI
jgi:hypothetical protein